MLKPDLCDYSDAYIFVTVEATANANKGDKELSFKNNALFGSCMSKKSITH